ncbi:MAG: hypothetical protein MI865_04860, partial [Proteobacteria bacterium]|nr:hypothetical protein [Pseudomonadota bacterium]
MIKLIANISFLSLLLVTTASYASGKMSEEDIKDVKRVEVKSDDEREKISIAAGLLSDYEISAKKLVASLDKESVNADQINTEAKKLLNLSETVIDSARFRLPQCDEYLAKTMTLKDMLDTISNESIEKDYHHDGALPKAPGECYHAKDLFVHPATVVVLTRDDPTLSKETRSSINAE